MNRQPIPAIQGSWEALLLQAEQLATRQNDQAIAIWRKMIDRLVAMPPNRLEAGNGHLRRLLREARLGLQGYLTQTDRPSEAIVLAQALMQDAPTTEERAYWDQYITDLLLYAGRQEEAIERLRAITVTADAEDIESWGELAFLYITLRRLDAAGHAIGEIEQRINRKQQQHAEADFSEDRAYLADLKVWLAVKHGLWDEAVAWFQHASVLDDYYRPLYARLVVDLIHAGQYKFAASLLEKHENRPLVLLFYQGVIAQHEGKRPEAEAFWRKAIAIEPSEEEDEYAWLEKILSYYYLGDKKGEGLGEVLTYLRERQEVSWMPLFLAALGWLLRGKGVDAQANLAMAQRFYRSLAKGHKLPYSAWFHCLDLLPTETRQSIEHYFDTSKN